MTDGFDAWWEYMRAHHFTHEEREKDEMTDRFTVSSVPNPAIYDSDNKLPTSLWRLHDGQWPESSIIMVHPEEWVVREAARALNVYHAVAIKGEPIH